jgi:uncharacterized protein YciI
LSLNESVGNGLHKGGAENGIRRDKASFSTPPAIHGSQRARWGYKGGMKHFLLFYEGAPDYLARRPQFRDAHLKHAWSAVERGDLVVAGALADPVEGAVLMFAGEDKSVAEDFARADPYVVNGLVARWHVREWTTVVGSLAANPVRPAAE